MKRRTRIKAGLIFGVAMAIIYILEDVFIDQVPTAHLFKTIIRGLFTGAIAGFLYGWLMGVFSNSKFVKQGTKIETGAGETILFEGGANHFKGIEGVGGMMYLTNQRLVFKSHKLNIQKHQLSIDLPSITEVARKKTLGILNNGLIVTTTDGRKEKFVVEQPEEWIKYLAKEERLAPLS
jgi:hypothetical protein